MPPENDAQEVFTFIIIVNNDELPGTFLLRSFFLAFSGYVYKRIAFHLITLCCTAARQVVLYCIYYIGLFGTCEYGRWLLQIRSTTS